MTGENYLKKLADMQTQIKELVPNSLKENGEIRMSNWIPVSESLPNEEEDVLVTVYFHGLNQKHANGWNDHIKPKCYVDIANQIDGQWFSYSDEYKVAKSRHEVIAWMALPKPYERKEE